MQTPKPSALWNYINRRHVTAKPFAVTWKGQSICLDYLQAIYELRFISERFPLDGRRIVEIGAGYGRTCHAIVSNHDVRSYTIIDLPNCLALSQKYLEAVLDRERFGRIEFILPERCEDVP